MTTPPARVADFRSDTFTLPDAAMRRAICDAQVGNSGFGEDPSVNALEAELADLFGCEASVFLPSATMANQIAIRVWTRPGDVVLIEQYGHSHYVEVGSMALIAGVQAQALPARQGILAADAIAAALAAPIMPSARATLIVLENTSNFGGGTVYPPAVLAAVFALAARERVPVHVDGARIWNALAATGADARTVMPAGGSMSVCFSKGLGAPMGAALLGDAAFIREARRVQTMLGGVMRQVGFMAAAALHGVRHNRARLVEDHANAAALATLLAALPGVGLDLDAVQTNIVYADFRAATLSAQALVPALAAQGVRVFALGSHLRFVTSMLVDRADCDRAAALLRESLGSA